MVDDDERRFGVLGFFELTDRFETLADSRDIGDLHRLNRVGARLVYCYGYDQPWTRNDIVECITRRLWCGGVMITAAIGLAVSDNGDPDHYGAGEVTANHHAATKFLSGLAKGHAAEHVWPAIAAVLVRAIAHYWLLADLLGTHPSGVDEERYTAVRALLVSCLLAGSGYPGPTNSFPARKSRP